jgi:hypothetical protein
MVPQPYPLFYGRPRNGELQTGRVVGWHLAGEPADLAQPRPVVLFQNADGTTGQPGYVELDGGEPYWIRDSEESLMAAYELHEKLARIKDATR